MASRQMLRFGLVLGGLEGDLPFVGLTAPALGSIGSSGSPSLGLVLLSPSLSKTMGGKNRRSQDHLSRSTLSVT